MSLPANGETWQSLGNALWELPDTELAALGVQLRDLAAGDPGRVAAVWSAFASIVTGEQEWRRPFSNAVPEG